MIVTKRCQNLIKQKVEARNRKKNKDKHRDN
jgi:hypothetical protein